MKTHLKIMLVAMAVAGLSQSASAVSFTEAIEQAILRNPEVQARWHQFRAANEEIAAAQGGYLPRVDVSAYAGHEWRQYPTTGNTSFNQPGAMIELRQMLFDGFATRSAVRQASYASQTRYYELLAASDSVAQETAKAYLDVLRYRKLTDLARDNWAIHKELYDQIEEKAKAGVGRRVDMEQAAGRLALAEANWVTEASNLHDVSARYERLTGTLPPADLGSVPALQGSLPKEGETLTRALNQNPSFLAAIANIRASRALQDAQKSANYPTFELRAARSLNRNEDGVHGNYHRGVVQLVMNYNLYKGGSDMARAKAAGESLNAAFDLRDKSCRDIRQETRIAQNDVKKLAEQIKYLDQHQLSTEKSRDAYRQQFDIGQRTLLDLLDTENELFEAKRALVNAETDYQLAHVRVLTQTHQLLPTLKLATLPASQPGDDMGGAEADDARIACGADITTPVVLDRAAAMAARPVKAVATKPDSLSGLQGTGIEVKRDGDTIRLLVPSSVTFNFNKADIKPEFMPVLDKVATAINDYPDAAVKVEGHTDSIGTAAYNQKLSERRAQNVRSYLVEHGVKSERIESKGYGLTRPIADNATDEGRAKNRRVEVVIMQDKK